MTYDLRLGAEAGSPQLRFTLTVLHAVARQQPWEERKPAVTVTDWRLGFRLAQAANHWGVRTERGGLPLSHAPFVDLREPDEQRYTVRAGEREVATGTRAPGWLTAVQGPDSVCLGVRDFWQNHPKRLRGGEDRLEVGLWHGPAPMSWEGGLAKTHELVLDVATGLRDYGDAYMGVRTRARTLSSISSTTCPSQWIARELSRFQGLGNERQIGWSLYALSALHEVTGSPPYLETVRAR